MTSEKVVTILLEDLKRKCEDVDICVFSSPNAIKDTIKYMVVDRRTGSKEYLEEKIGKSNIFKTMKLYDKILGAAQRLVCARCNMDEGS